MNNYYLYTVHLLDALSYPLSATMVAFSRIAITTLALGGSVSARRRGECPAADAVKTAQAKPAATVKATGLADFKPGVQWEICIHHPIKHDSAADLIPTKAKVWDIDMGHAQEFPNMIPMLKVSRLTATYWCG
jgi:hypothetical protein